MRHTADSITDDVLDALYAERDRLAAAVAAVAVEAAKWAELAPAGLVPPGDWGLTPGDATLAEAGRHLQCLIALSAHMPPVLAPAAPEPRCDPAGPSEVPVRLASPPGEAENGQNGPSRRLGAHEGPSRPPAC